MAIKLMLIKPKCENKDSELRLEKILKKAFLNREYDLIDTVDELKKNNLKHKKLVFAIALGEAGINIEYYRMVEYLTLNKNALVESVAGIIVDGKSELFTKNISRQLAFAANFAGCTFPGKALVEGTGSLANFAVAAKLLSTDNYKAYEMSCCDLVDRVEKFQIIYKKPPLILAIHASSTKTSNTLLLWEKVKQNIAENAKIEEISLREGKLLDCRGCKYEDCLHFGESGGCFYGGVMVDKVYPAIVKCDVLVMICPNYNDAVSANITAFINRLSSVFRTHDFTDKKVYAIIVSGYSGGDIVAEQIISAISFNKSMILPGRFAMIETANNPKSILEVKDIEKKAMVFAESIVKN